MNSHHRRELILGFVLLSLISLSFAMRQQPEPEWSSLLQQPANLDPAYTALQMRADLSLQRLEQTGVVWE